MTTEQAISLGIVAMAVLGAVGWQLRRGVLSSRALVDAPERRGQLSILDLGAALLLWVGGAMVGASLASMWWDQDDPQSTLWIMAATQIGMLPAVGYVLVRARVAMIGGWHAFGFRFDRLADQCWTTLRVAVFILPATFLTLAISGWLWKQTGYESPNIAHPTLLAIRDAGLFGQVALVIMAVLIAPIVEELLFRGLTQTVLLQQRLVSRRWPAILIASMVFTFMHLGLPVPAYPGLFVLALGLGYVYERTGAIWPAMLVHLLFNAANVAAVLGGLVVE